MRKHQTDKKIFIATFVLTLIGTIMVSIVGPSYANTHNAAYAEKMDPNSIFTNQVVYLVIAFIVMMFFLKLPLDRIQKKYGNNLNKQKKQLIWNLPEIILGASFLMCIYLMIGSKVKLPFVHYALGAYRWLRIGSIQIQVAEFLKFGTLLYFAKQGAIYRARGGFDGERGYFWKKITDFCYRKILKQKRSQNIRERQMQRMRTLESKQGRMDMRNLKLRNSWDRLGKNDKKEEVERFWIKYLGVLGVSLFFVVVAQKDLGSALPLVAIAFSILLMSGVSMKIFIVLCVIGASLVGVAILLAPHRLERLATFRNGESSNSYHIENALIAIGSGGLFGVGIGNNVQTAGYLPESITDSMFAVICETIGFFGAVTVLGFYWLLLGRILKVADCTKDGFLQLVAIGVFAWIGGHVIINIAAITGLVPLTGIPLPLLSKGGTSLIFTMATIGLVLNISQYTARMAFSDQERRAE